MNKLPLEKRAEILGMMVEGVSLRSISRLTGASKNTIAKLLVDAGLAFAAYQDKTLRGLTCQRVQVDEIWSFVGAKEKNVPQAQKGLGRGDVWCWTALDADTKLMVSWLVGGRDAEYATAFIQDVSERVANRIQLTSDGHGAYLRAVENVFGVDIDYAQLVKIYGAAPEGQRRYSPAECVGAKPTPVRGNPDPKHISTSYVERANLSIRMGLRRYTRLTNAFSKKFENHVHGLAIYFMYYNFVRIHQTTRLTPAMAAGVTDKLWELTDMVRVIEDYERDELRNERSN
jgi:IS1 family transposase